MQQKSYLAEPSEPNELWGRNHCCFKPLRFGVGLLHSNRQLHQGLPSWLRWVKNPPAMWETSVWSLRWENSLEEGRATHASILAWRIPWTEELSGLSSGRAQLPWKAWPLGLRLCHCQEALEMLTGLNRMKLSKTLPPPRCQSRAVKDYQGAESQVENKWTNTLQIFGGFCLFVLFLKEKMTLTLRVASGFIKLRMRQWVQVKNIFSQRPPPLNVMYCEGTGSSYLNAPLPTPLSSPCS